MLWGSNTGPQTMLAKKRYLSLSYPLVPAIFFKKKNLLCCAHMIGVGMQKDTCEDQKTTLCSEFSSHTLSEF